MNKFRVVSVMMIVAMLAGLTGFGVHNINAQQYATRPEPIKIGAMPMSGTHLVPPTRSALDAILAKDGLPLDATPEQRAAAEKAWFEKFQKQSDTWVNPKFQEAVIEREKQLAGLPNNVHVPANMSETAIVPVEANVFAMAVDFGETETFTIPVDDGTGACVTTTTTIVGPRQGEVPYPTAPDNFTLWYSPTQTADADFYEDIIFGYTGAGRVRTADMVDPYDGQPGVNLAGYTVQDYFDNVAGDGNVTIQGDVVGWVTVPHSEGYYGADNCATGNHGGGAGVPVSQLVVDAATLFMADHPDYDWTQFDANEDGILDTFWIIHAGMGQEAGGGAEGPFSIWSHSSDLRYNAAYPNGFQVYEGDPATDDDDIYIGPYTMQPEMAETGVFAEEFGHNFFGLPDLYVSDANNSIGDWAIMSGGAWMGWLGGTVPASMPLWFKEIAGVMDGDTFTFLNWQEPYVVRDYKDAAAEVEIGQLEKTPNGVNKGVRINLPDVNESIPNNAGDGPGAYSGTGRDDTDITLTKQLAIPAGAAGVLSFDAYWEIEEDWDYGYVMVGSTFLQDTTGYFTDTNPNGNNLGWGLTGSDWDTLEFDLSAYAGTTVNLTLRYKTDAAATEAGWWVDNVMLDGVLVDDFAAATGPGTFPGWTNSDPGWYTVPSEMVYPNYYLVEWRSMTKYDAKIHETAYIHNSVDPDVVSRIPYNMPAALIYYRNTKYGATYAQRGNYADPPSLGSKYQLLIVDQNWDPVRLMNGNTYQGYFSGRVSAYDAGLTLQNAEAWTIPYYYGTGIGYSFPAKDAVTHFNDALGYYGGYFYGSPCAAGYLCYVERDGSAVVPARGLYSTRIVDFNMNPIYGFYGYPWAPSWLGSGNPADDNVQHGVNIQLLSKTGDDAYNSVATLSIYNYSVDFLSKIVSHRAKPEGVYATYQFNIQNVGTEDASDLYLSWAPAYGQQITSLKVDGPKNLPMPAGANQQTMDLFILEFPSLPAGQEIVVTIDTIARVDDPGDYDYYLPTEGWGGDGQIERGPFWLDLEGEVNFTFFPTMIR